MPRSAAVVPTGIFRVTAVLVALAGVASALPAGAATPREVEQAIANGKAYLYSLQRPDGSWPEPMPDDKGDGKHFGGWTAIATYALLAAGESPQDPRMQKAVRWLGNADIQGIYSLGLRAQVWTFLPLTNDVKQAVARDHGLFMKSRDIHGRYGYTIKGGGEHNSTSQYGVLGMWACAQVGAEVPGEFWQRVEKGWLDCQGQDGSWAYESLRPLVGAPANREPRASMTAAGVATLFITQDYLHANEGVRCQGNVTNPAIEAGMKWMADHFDPKASNTYLLYGIERIGVASGYKYFGTHDWYRAGAETLVRRQEKNGAWPGGYGPIVDTSFSLVFLARGRAPVVMNKLQYDVQPDRPKEKAKAGDWNQRPRDVANAVRWVGRQLERDLNWQIVNLNVPVEELYDAPILYVSGDDALNFTDEEKQKLKQFVEQGGLILGNADCGRPAFAKSFQALGAELFPAYEFRVLPPDHVILKGQQFNAEAWKGKLEVRGMSNGVRELMLLVPNDDAARAWQLQDAHRRRADFELAANVFLYAVDKKDLRFKGETHVLARDAKVKPTRTVKVARLKYNGNWDPEPGGWRRLAVHLHNSHKVDVQVETVRPGEADAGPTSAPATPPTRGRGQAAPRAGGATRPPSNARAPGGKPSQPSPAAPSAAAAPSAPSAAPGNLTGYAVAHLTGTGPFKLSEAARAEVKRFVESGGTLVVDAAGGGAGFVESADSELWAVFGADAAKQLDEFVPPSHDLYHLASPLDDVSYRLHAREVLVGELKSPRLRAIEVKGRAAVFFSKEDLSGGLVGQPVDGIVGYSPRTATQLMSNVLLYAAGDRRPPATRPSTQPATKPATMAKPTK